MLAKLHAKLGDFWWYSIMLFCACRAADVLNAFVGLWFVPKYVDPSELGAVMPLTQFANFLAIPIIAFANTFRNEISQLSINKEFGKLKTLMRSVFVASAVFLFTATVIAQCFLPCFLERIRVVKGSLAVIIIASSFISAIAPIYSNALQALKKFHAQAFLNIAGAPVRLITMLVAMPFRPLTGYFVGQASTPFFSVVTSLLCLKKELSVSAEPYWNKYRIRKFATVFKIFLLSGFIGGFCLLIESTVIRQRLTDLDSAGYYVATRFSEISSFLVATLSFTIFPFTAEKAARGEDFRPLMIKALLANAVFCIMIALPFFFYGQLILSLLPHGEQYSNYWWVIPWLIGISFISSIFGLYSTSEISANRFGFLKWCLPLELIYAVLLLVVTGYGYLTEILPESWSGFLRSHNIQSLDTMLWWMTGINGLKAIICIFSITKSKRPKA